MINIRSTISFNEFYAIVDKVINDCFPDNVYSPANYELSLRTSLILAFAPDYDLSKCEDNNSLWEKVTDNKAEEILNNINKNNLKNLIETAIKNGIDYRIKILSSGSVSTTDLALSKLFDVISEKVNNIEIPTFNKEDLNSIFKAVTSIKNDTSTEDLINAILNNSVKRDT